MTAIGTLGRSCVAALAALGRELAAWRASRERVLFCAQAVVSVALAVLFAHVLGLAHTWWAAISGFAVMRDSWSGCLERGGHRVLGTLAGAAAGVFAAPLTGDRPWLFVPLLGVVGGYTVFRANGSKASYAWVLGGVTALMVIYEAHTLHSAGAIFGFALSRVVEVVVGTLAAVLVSGTTEAMLRRERARRTEGVAAAESADDAPEREPEPFPTPAAPPARAIRLRLGIDAGLAVSIVAVLVYVLHLPGFAQAMVSAIALLILPADALATRSTPAVLERMAQRLLGCLLAGVLGVGLIPLMNGAVLPCMLALSAGVWIGCHVQTGAEGASYVGRQFTVAFIMVFVQDHHWSADPKPALMRLSGILIGVIVLGCVMFAVRALPFAQQARGGSTTT